VDVPPGSFWPDQAHMAVRGEQDGAERGEARRGQMEDGEKGARTSLELAGEGPSWFLRFYSHLILQSTVEEVSSEGQR